jgi:ribose transport system permease protein
MRQSLGRQLARSRAESWWDVLFVPLVLLVLVAYLSFSSEFFLTSTNLTNILLQGALLAIVAFGVTFTILSGELDLSVGAGVALVSVVSAIVMRDSGSILLGVGAGIGVGVLIGVINGGLVTLLQVPSFIATLGMLFIAQGVARAVTNGATIGGLPAGISSLTDSTFLGLRWIIWLVLVVFAALYFVQTQTAFGIRVFAVGGNREASRLSAIPVDRVRFMCFLISGITMGIGGVALTARVESGQPNAGQLLALTAIAAIVVGGTNLLGGRGSLAKTAWGVLLISVLENGLDLEGINDDLQQVIVAFVFIAAASTDFFRGRLLRRVPDSAVGVSDGAVVAPAVEDESATPVPSPRP